MKPANGTNTTQASPLGQDPTLMGNFMGSNQLFSNSLDMQTVLMNNQVAHRNLAQSQTQALSHSGNQNHASQQDTRKDNQKSAPVKSEGQEDHNKSADNNAPSQLHSPDSNSGNNQDNNTPGVTGNEESSQSKTEGLSTIAGIHF